MGHKFAAIAVGVLMMSISTVSFAAEKRVLRVLIWDEYLSEKVVSRFEGMHNVRLEQITYEKEDDVPARLADKKESYDLAMTSTSYAAYMRDDGLIAKIDPVKVKRAPDLAKKWDVDPDYFIPYAWGTTGIAYRPEHFPSGISKWADLLPVLEQQQGKIALIAENEEILHAGRYLAGDTSGLLWQKSQIDLALATLKKYSTGIRFEYSDEEDAALVHGEVWAAQAYSSDIAYLNAEYDAGLVFVIPEDGCNIWQDGFVIPLSATNVDLAYAFLNYISEPKVAAKNANELQIAPSNPLALVYLDKALLSDKVVHPSFAGLDRCEMYATLDSSLEEAVYAIDPEAEGLPAFPE